MARILIHVEGETEETFVNEVLADHLRQFDHIVTPRLIGNARLRSRRGGIRSWDSTQRDIIRHLQSDPSGFASTMVDFYGLPATGNGVWPGRREANSLPSGNKAAAVESAISKSVSEAMGRGFDPSRFVPFVVMHEFEALLFSDVEKFAAGIGRPNLAQGFDAVRREFSSPEEINDSPETAPSKRVLRICPEYQKPIMGTLAALEIGLQKVREECPHFSGWVSRLEALP